MNNILTPILKKQFTVKSHDNSGQATIYRRFGTQLKWAGNVADGEIYSYGGSPFMNNGINYVKFLGSNHPLVFIKVIDTIPMQVQKFLGFSTASLVTKYPSFTTPNGHSFCFGGMPLTDPYIIRITNDNPAPVSNIVILDAANRLRFAGAGDSFGNPAGVHLAAGSPNVQYQQILHEIMVQPFTADMVQIQGAGANITQPLSVTYMNAKGVQQTRAIVPIFDPYQSISTAVRVSQRFKIDGFTRITIPMISGNSTTMVYIYPLETNLNFGGKVTRMFTSTHPCNACEKYKNKSKLQSTELVDALINKKAILTFVKK